MHIGFVKCKQTVCRLRLARIKLLLITLQRKSAVEN